MCWRVSVTRCRCRRMTDIRYGLVEVRGLFAAFEAQVGDVDCDKPAYRRSCDGCACNALHGHWHRPGSTLHAQGGQTPKLIQTQRQGLTHQNRSLMWSPSVFVGDAYVENASLWKFERPGCGRSGIDRELDDDDRSEPGRTA